MAGLKFVCLFLFLTFRPAWAAAPSPPEHALAVEFSRDGETIYKHRAKSFSDSQGHNIQSLSKSILALLVGIAKERGTISSLDENVAPLLWNKSERSITWKSLLTMRSGLPSTSGPNYGAWVSSDNWVNYFQGKEGDEDFSYSTGDSHLLAVALRQKVDGNLQKFSSRHLFGPLGIKTVGWDKDPQGNEFGGNNMRMRFSDVKKLGSLLLNDGKQEGTQIVSSNWIKEMWAKQTDADEEFVGFQVRGYGYFWWLVKVNGADGVCALGYGGQFLCLFPEINAQFTIFSRTPESGEPLRQHYQEIQSLLSRLVGKKN